MMHEPHSAIARTARYEKSTSPNPFHCQTSLSWSQLTTSDLSLQKFTGGPFGVTSKIPKSSFKIKSGSEHVKVHEADNGSGVILHREFCDTCGTGLLEYGVRYSPSSSKHFLDLPVRQPGAGPRGFRRVVRKADLYGLSAIGECRRFYLHLLRNLGQSRRLAT